MFTAAVRYTAGVICISFAFRLLLGCLLAASDFADGDENDENDDFKDDADQRPDCRQTICVYINKWSK